MFLLYFVPFVSSHRQLLLFFFLDFWLLLSNVMSAGWKDIKYRQDLPPPGGYGAVPYKRNLPVRGPSGAIMLGLLVATQGLGYYIHGKSFKYAQMVNEENNQAELCLEPLLDAERDRAFLRNWKEKVESEALNIVGTGYDPDYKPGQQSFHVDRFEFTHSDGEVTLMTRIKDWYNFFGVPRCGP